MSCRAVPTACGPVDAGVAVTCHGDYLDCDGPEDCPGSLCCLHPAPLGGADNARTACEGSIVNGVLECPSFEETICHTDADCRYVSLSHCNSPMPLAGHGALYTAVRTCGT